MFSVLNKFILNFFTNITKTFSEMRNENCVQEKFQCIIWIPRKIAKVPYFLINLYFPWIVKFIRDPFDTQGHHWYKYYKSKGWCHSNNFDWQQRRTMNPVLRIRVDSAEAALHLVQKYTRKNKWSHMWQSKNKYVISGNFPNLVNGPKCHHYENAQRN